MGFLLLQEMFVQRGGTVGVARVPPFGKLPTQFSRPSCFISEFGVEWARFKIFIYGREQCR